MEALDKLGIDLKSMLVYVVNFGIILFIMARYAYKPILNILDKRRNIIEGSLNEAETLKKEFQRKMTEIEQEKKDTEQKLKQELENLKKYTEQKRDELIKDMDIQRAQMMEQAHAEIEQKMAEIMNSAEKKTQELIKKIVLWIVHNKVPTEVIQESIGEAWEKEIKKITSQ